MLGTVWVNFEIFVTNISIMIESSFLFEIIYEKSLEYFFLKNIGDIGSFQFDENFFRKSLSNISANSGWCSMKIYGLLLALIALAVASTTPQPSVSQSTPTYVFYSTEPYFDVTNTYITGYVNEMTENSAEVETVEDQTKVCIIAQEDLAAAMNTIDLVIAEANCEIACEGIEGEKCGYLVNSLSLKLFVVHFFLFDIFKNKF